jgi:hypothetical protein
MRMAEVDPEAEAARVLLRRASPALAARALRQLEMREHTVGVHFRELNAQGDVARRWQRTVERTPNPERGEDETLLGEVLAGQGGSLALLRHVDPIEILLPEDPPYLRSDNRDYVLRLLPEREIDGRRVRGAQASRRPGVDEPVTLVRSWVDALTGEPAAVELVRASSSMLLSEEARIEVSLGWAEDGVVLPQLARVEASLQLLAEPPRRFAIDMALEAAGVRAP